MRLANERVCCNVIPPNHLDISVCVRTNDRMTNPILTDDINVNLSAIWLANAIVGCAAIAADGVPIGVHHFQHIVGDICIAAGQHIVLSTK